MQEPTRQVKSIFINRNKCIGAATCVVMAPQAFELDTDGISTVMPTFLQNTDSELFRAALGCPTGAISLIGQDGKEIPLDELKTN